MTLRLFVMRHAKSSWSDPGLDDFERPLNERGRRDARRMGQHLRRSDVVFDCVISSPAKRARQTVKRLLKAMRSSAQVTLEPALYLASLEDWRLAVAHVRQKGSRCALMVGHNPGIEDLVRYLCPLDETALSYMKLMPTAAIAEISLRSLKGRPGAQTGELVDLHRPKQITV